MRQSAAGASSTSGTIRGLACAFALIAATSALASAAADDAVTSASIEAWLARAAAQRELGDRAAEIHSLARVLEFDSTHPAAHERLAELSGPAPPAARGVPDAEIRRAVGHPYDPAALLRGGEALAQQGQRDDAVEMLEKSVWLADLDPAAALDALLLLRELSPGWAARRVVPVHVYADAAARSAAGWRFAMRTLWLSASNSLDSVLRTRFVPIAIGAFDPLSDPSDLDAVHHEFLERVTPPEEGILAAITAQPAATSAGRKTGVAELLGRSLVVRAAPGTSQSRVLAHEILHLYGAIHVLDDVESLMNPTSASLKLDAASYRIARATVRRGFAAGGIERNLLPAVDLRETTAAYVEALSLNLAFRDAGILEARRQVAASPETAATRAQRATQLDPHLADAARVVAVLMIADSQRARALRLLDLATDLYGPDSERGRSNAREADRLRDDLRRAAANARDS